MTPISDAYQREHARKRDTDPKDCQYNKGLECGMECARKLEAELADMTRLAIGGDGTTHWYWKDQAEELAKENAELKEARR